ncbi:MAG: hypothetical protein DDT38_00939 [Firmicutes bacterium]|nr:hypothetical protein [candidate division NPL-UPA2 bacterium]
MLGCGCDYRMYLFVPPDISRVYAHFGCPALDRSYGQSIVVVNVGDEGNSRARDKRGKSRQRRFVWHCDAHDLTPGPLQAGNLLFSSTEVSCLCIGHALNRDGVMPAYCYAADLNYASLSAHVSKPKRYSTGVGRQMSLAQSVP